MCDVCKYPEKTRRRVTKLLTELTLKGNFSMDQACQRGVPGSRVKGWSTDVNVTGVRGQQAASRVRSYGTMKRGIPENDQEARSTGVKKAKGSYATTLVTKAHASASGLSKPFKTPFKTPITEEVAPPQFPPSITLPVCEEATETNRDASVKQANDQYDTVKKVDVARQQECMGAAKELEFGSWSMSSTQNGYTQRVNETVAVIGAGVRKLLLEGFSCANDDDDAQAIAGLIRRLCRNNVKSR
ncbi:hypothetical protein C0992_004136 [Termitomyces sp. T32_za158]|nr:hypothetical protein C0992_004136 [Termitomyces sp. T32_za158]